MPDVRKLAEVTCDDCYFRRAQLCALPPVPCPTFRPAKAEPLAPPRQPQLVPRAVSAAHAAA